MTASGSKAFRAWKLAHSQRSLQRRNLDAEGHAALGSSVKQAHKFKRSGLGDDSNILLFFLPRKYEDTLSSSADKYKRNKEFL